MKKLLIVAILLLVTSCGVNFKLSTLNTPTQTYVDENYFNDIKIDTLNEFQFRNKIRTDIGFRLDFARYALSQPRSFDWNNRLLGRHYDSRYNSYYWSWNRDRMWNDWAWGFTPHRWSLFGYDRWGYNNYNWMGNVHYGWGWNGYYGNGWNNYYGWNGYYGQSWRRGNTSYIYGRRGSNISVQQRNGRSQASMIESSRRRTNTNTRINNTRIIKEDNKEILIIKDRNGNPVRYEIKPNNNTKPRGYGRPENNRNNSNTIRNNRNNSTPVIRNNRNNSTPVIRNNRNNSTPVIRNNNSNTRPNTTPTNRGRKSSGGSSVRR